MLSLVLAAFLSVTVGHPVTPNSASDQAHVYSSKISTVSLISAPSSTSLTPDISSQQHIAPHPAGALAPSGYTHEVELARQQFQKAFDEAAALAAAAPDDTDLHVTLSTSDQSPVPATTYTEDGASTVIHDFINAVEAGPPKMNFHKGSDNTSSYKASSPEVQVHTVTITRTKAPEVVTSAQPVLTSNEVYTPAGVATDFTREVEAARKELLTSYEEVSSGALESQQTSHHYGDSQLPAPDSTTPAGHQHTVILTSHSITPSGFTPEVEQARKEFMKTYEAAVALAAKSPDYSAITHTSSAQAPAQVAGPQPTPEVAKATAEFMAAWNAAVARVATIEAKLVKSSSSVQATIGVPEQTQTVQEIKKAVEEFVAASNAATQRTSTVQQAISSGAFKPAQSTEEVQTTTAEFMSAWQAAARKASKIEQAVLKATSLPTGVPQHVEAMAEAQKATAEFMAAWNAAAARVPQIETAIYSVANPDAVGGTREFLNLFKSAEQKAVQPSGLVGSAPVGINAGFADSVGSAIAYAGATALSPETVATLKSFPLSHRLFAPIQGLPVYHNCKCE